MDQAATKDLVYERWQAERRIKVLTEELNRIAGILSRVETAIKVVTEGSEHSGGGKVTQADWDQAADAGKAFAYIQELTNLQARIAAINRQLADVPADRITRPPQP